MSVAVVLVIDCTGSMEEIHAYLGKKLSDIAKMFSEEGMPVHFAAVGFRDFPDVRQRKHWFELQDFNLLDEAHEGLSNWLLHINAFGGGSNFGESGIAALVKGLQDVTWPDARRRVAALFTDDKSHMPDHGVDTWDDVKKAIRDSDTEQIHLFTTERKVENYDELDGVGYDVIRHELAKDNLKNVDDDQLEKAIREFVRMSSEGGGFGGGTLIAREETNPFDEPSSDAPKEEKGDGFDVDWDVD